MHDVMSSTHCNGLICRKRCPYDTVANSHAPPCFRAWHVLLFAPWGCLGVVFVLTSCPTDLFFWPTNMAKWSSKSRWVGGGFAPFHACIHVHGRDCSSSVPGCSNPIAPQCWGGRFDLRRNGCPVCISRLAGITLLD